MTDKLSQETDDVLSSLDDQEQTLGGMTEDTENQTQNGNGNGKPAKKSGGKGSSKNGIIVVGIAIGLAVVLGVGYFTFIKKSPAPKAKTIKKKEVEENKETLEAPKPTAPVAPVENGFPADNASKESQTAADFLNRDATPIPILNEVAKEVNPAAPAVEVVSQTTPVVPVAPAVVDVNQLQPVVPVAPVAPAVVDVNQLQPVAPVAPVAPAVVDVNQLQPVAPVAPVAPAVVDVNQLQPVVPTPKPVDAPVAIQDTSINAAFDSMATRVDAVSTRVDGLEKFKSAQEDLNNQIEKRIIRLEGFHEGDNTEAKAKPVKKASTSKKTNSGTVAPVRNSAPKPAPKPKAKPKENIDGDVLVDKSSVKARAEASKPASLEQYQFHSIYDNRVWWRKADGSLETATVGGRLPSGEVIKEVNHDKFEVITDKRTIRKQ